MQYNNYKEKDMKSYRVYGLNGCKMLLDDRTTRYRITKIDIVEDIVNTSKISILNTFDNVHTYSKKVFRGKFNNNRAQGIVIEFLADFDSQFDFNRVDKKNYSIVILDSIKDPQNLGQIMRTCECAGVDSIVLPSNRSISITDTVLQASQGAFTNVEIYIEKNINRFIDKIKKHSFWVAGFENSVSACNWFDVDMKGRVGFVFGSEGEGIKSLTLKKCDYIGTIPMLGKVNSLNVSASVSAVLFERIRQIKTQ